mmetsp:Transcript_43065/g.125261  ORF Transcript_43065/g.125261 Transcript_43065/m.125261 type:complete len:237 (-) Transcript_43065:2418-3128(-)
MARSEACSSCGCPGRSSPPSADTMAPLLSPPPARSVKARGVPGCSALTPPRPPLATPRSSTPKRLASEDCDGPRRSVTADRIATSVRKPWRMSAELAPDLAQSFLKEPNVPPGPTPPGAARGAPARAATRPGSSLTISRFTLPDSFLMRPPGAPARPLWPVHVGSLMWWLARSRAERCNAATARLAIMVAPSRTIFRSSSGCSTLSWLKLALIPLLSYKDCKSALFSDLLCLDSLC